jgi:hypothetical protein
MGFGIRYIPNHKMVGQHGATFRSRDGPYQAHYLGRAPDHELNNILEIGYKWLSDHGFVHKKPKPMPGGADPEQQREFIKRLFS